jgi:hypothetical protein
VGAGAAIAVGTGLADAPVVRDILPVGLTRGESVELIVTGERLDDTRALHSHDGPGLAFGEPKIINGKEVRIPVTVAPDCPTGAHRVRLRSATGWSYLRLLAVAAEPRIEETEPNNEAAAAAEIKLPACIEGEMKLEDVDVFAVHLKAGQRFTAVAESVRLGRGLLDLHLSLADEKRFVLAASDDTPLLGQDPMISVAAPADGRYFLTVREAAYEGAEGARYRVRAGHWKQPIAVHPCGGNPGASSEVMFLFGDGGTEKRTITWPATTGSVRIDFTGEDGLAAPASLPVRVDPMPVFLESEPNNNREQPTSGATGLPVAFHGILATTGDQDFFALPLKKGEAVEVEGWGRRLGSAVDLAIDVFAPDGKHRGGNDDAEGKPDSKHTFTAEVDGTHIIKARDSLGAGGPAFVYRIEARKPAASLALSLPSPELNNTQAGQTVTVAQGNRAAMVFNVARRGTGGDLNLELRGAPTGVHLFSHVVPNGVGQALVLFEAASDAPAGGAFAEMLARKTDNSLEGSHGLLANLVTYGNNEAIFQAREDRLPVAVSPALPLKVSATVTTPLVQGGLAEVRVKVERTGDFKQAVELRMPWKPTGVSAPPSVTLPEGATEAIYPLDAEAGAVVGTHPIVVTANWGAGTTAASGFFPLVVTEPNVRGNIEMLAIPAGGSGQLHVTLEHPRPFSGEAELQVLGLPPGIETPVVKLSAGQDRVVVPVNAKAEAPVGKHSTLFCRVSVPGEGGTVVHRLGSGGVLRVDKPSAGKNAAVAKAAAPPAAPAAKPGSEAPKPLSRLEQLRQRANP